MKILLPLVVGIIFNFASSSPVEKRTSPPRPCVRIAEALLEMAESQNQMGMYGPDLYRLTEVFTGVDLHNEQSFTVLMCELVEVGRDTDAIVSMLQQSGVESTLVHRMYDYFVASMKAGLPRMEQMLAEDEEDEWSSWRNEYARKFIDLYNALDNMGFLDLDPVGVQEMHDWFLAPQLSETARGKRKRTSTPKECGDLTALLKDSYRSEYSFLVQEFDWTEDKIDDLICSIAGADSVADITSVLNAHSVPQQLVDLLFQQFQQLGDMIPYLERVINTPNDSNQIWIEERRASAANTLRLLYAMRDAGYF